MNRRQFLKTVPSVLAGVAIYAQRITRRIASAHEGWGQPMQFHDDGLTFPVYFDEHPREVVTGPRTWRTYLPFMGNGG